jgi:putative aldouronate transport system permease protein
MLICMLICLYPFYYMLIYSLSSPHLARFGLTFYPKGITFDNYRKVLTLPNILPAAIVSVSRTVLGTMLTVLCCSFFAYLLTKPMYCRKLIYRILIITMYVNGGLIPNFLIMRLYGLNNNYLIYILPTALSAYNVILIKTFFEQLPNSLEESAVLDGASTFVRWWQIIMPLSKPILATIAVFSAVGQWNAWFDAHIYMTDSKKWSLQYILYRYLKEAQQAASMVENNLSGDLDIVEITPEAIRMTITAVITIPILVVYPFMQRYFVKGIMLGAVKG